MAVAIEKKFITYEWAIKLTQAAIEHAKTLNLSIAVAIIDSVGNLIAFARMDDCCLIGILGVNRPNFRSIFNQIVFQ